MEQPENLDILLSRSILSVHGVNWSSLPAANRLVNEGLASCIPQGGRLGYRGHIIHHYEATCRDDVSTHFFPSREDLSTG